MNAADGRYIRKCVRLKKEVGGGEKRTPEEKRIYGWKQRKRRRLNLGKAKQRCCITRLDDHLGLDLIAKEGRAKTKLTS